MDWFTLVIASSLAAGALLGLSIAMFGIWTYPPEVHPKGWLTRKLHKPTLWKSPQYSSRPGCSPDA